jgi:hypothetical protein
VEVDKINMDICKSVGGQDTGKDWDNTAMDRRVVESDKRTEEWKRTT